MQACNFDLGDCTTDLCSPGCTRTMVNDNQCDEACLTRECQWDGADCDCAAGCLVTWLGDGECDAQCNIAQCDFDAGDCSGSSSPTAPCSSGCLSSQQGDGICQPACNVPKCQWDFGDCHFSRRVWPALAEVGGGQAQQPAQQAAGSASGNSSRARETVSGPRDTICIRAPGVCVVVHSTVTAAHPPVPPDLPNMAHCNRPALSYQERSHTYSYLALSCSQ